MSLFRKPPGRMNPAELTEALRELRPYIHGAIIRSNDGLGDVSRRLEEATTNIGKEAKGAVRSMGVNYGMD
jgi:hypothetical protein